MHGRKVGRAFMGRLMFGPYPLGVSGQKVGLAFLGRLVAGPFPFIGRLAMGVGPGPKVPTPGMNQMLRFSLFFPYIVASKLALHK